VLTALLPRNTHYLIYSKISCLDFAPQQRLHHIIAAYGDMLEKEESKLWHFSAVTLFILFKEELATGKITYPEEA